LWLEYGSVALSAAIVLLRRKHQKAELAPLEPVLPANGS